LAVTDSASGADPDKAEDPIGLYKRLLRTYLDRRPSGTRQRIATAIGTHRSFVSQITNPGYRVPLPAQHVATIMAVCHFSPEERAAFLAAYEAAHPGQLIGLAEPEHRSEGVPAGGPDREAMRGVWIPLPAFADPVQAMRVTQSIHAAAAAIIAVAELAQPPSGPPNRSHGADDPNPGDNPTDR
jgi:hypothetical protein